MTLPDPRFRTSGFTLLEVLVAMMILSITVVVLMQVFSGSFRAVHKATGYSRAVIHGRGKMGELLLPEAIQPGEYAGEFADGYRWNARISPISSERDSSLSPADSDKALTALVAKETRSLFQIQLRISWTDGERQREEIFTTLRMARPLAVESTG